MQYVYLKNTGLKISRLCLGTMMFGGQTNENDSLKILDYATDNGVNFLDTADIYVQGKSEEIIGKAIKNKRDEIVLATKVCGPAHKYPNGMGLGRKHIIKNIEESLTRLNTDYVDILYMHFPDKATPAEECIETMTNLIRSGKIRYYGVSNYSAWQCCELIHKAKEMNAIAPVVTESVYNVITRGIENEMVGFLKKYNMGLTAFNPLAGGLLTGKHNREKAVEGTRFSLEKGYVDRYWKEKNFDALDILASVANEYSLPMTKLAIKWLTDKDYVDSVICGVSKLEQVKQNISFFDEEKADSEMIALCDEAWDLIKGTYFNYSR